MFRRVKLPNDVVNTIRNTTRDFLDYAVTDVSKQLPREYHSINTSIRRMRDVYRHCLCLALGLQSTPNFTGIDAVYPLFTARMREQLGKYLECSEEYRRGVLQFGVNCFIDLTDSRRGY